MSNSKLISATYPAYSGNYTKGRNGKKIEMIAIHHMAGVLSAKQCGAIWQKVGRKGSSNYGIGNGGEIGLYVDEVNASWCNNNYDSNCKSVTIEVSNSSTGGNWEVGDKALNSLIELVADIAKRNNLGTLVKGKNVVWHSMYVATTCPGPYLMSKLDYIIDKANRLNKEETSTNTQPVTNTSKKVKLPKCGYFQKGDSGTDIERINDFYYNVFPSYEKTLKRNKANVLGNLFGENTLAWTKEFQKRAKADGKYNDKVDGYIGSKTLNAMRKYGFKY